MRRLLAATGFILCLAGCGPAPTSANDAGRDAGLFFGQGPGQDAGTDAGSCAPDGNACSSNTDCCNSDCNQTQGLCAPAVNCTCACTTLASAGGCGDICNDTLDGSPSTPNFCNMAAPLRQCQECLMVSCQFTAAQLGDYTACQ